jgi:hypothetical protein
MALTSCAHAAAPPKAPDSWTEYEVWLPSRPGALSTTVDLRAWLANRPPAQRRHRVATPDEARHWNGMGDIPIAVERRPLTAARIDGQAGPVEMEGAREALALAPGQGSELVAILSGVPLSPDVDAWRESAAWTLEVARRAKAPLVDDRELDEVMSLKVFTLMQAAPGPDLRSPVSMSSTLTEIKFTPQGGLRLQGLRRAGLPDVLITRRYGALEPYDLLLTIGQMLVAGSLAARPCSDFVVHTDGKEWHEVNGSSGRPGGVVALGFACDEGRAARDHRERNTHATGSRTVSSRAAMRTGGAPDVLTLRFPVPAGHPEDERFMRAMVDSGNWPVSQWPRDDEVALATATSRALQRYEEAYDQPQGKGHPRVIVVRGLRTPGRRALENVEYWEVMTWRDESGSTLARQLTGDPRAGAGWRRYPPGTQVGDSNLEFVERNIVQGDIEDVLFIDDKGRVQGGDAMALVQAHTAATSIER